MGSVDIQAKIKKGLARAVSKTGSSNSELVYRIRKTQGNDPLNPSSSEAETLLVNAIFKNYEQGLTDINIQAGDRQLVSDADVQIKANDIIRQGTTRYKVIAVSEAAPTSDVLNYISQVRVQ